MILRKSTTTGLGTFFALLLCVLWACGQGNKTHTVTLTWQASKSVVKGYNVYRAAKSGGPYARINSKPVPGLSYQDKDVQSGKTYYYVTRSVDADGKESGNSNEIMAAVP
ncbi:MAG TPA: fibronectin type III domain-containing protein [Candidatus Dormibacteraeota bacterium]|nr:fibronectin type III domain-containing protein [Candidatus Dormibacteraeota bacterium]